MTDAIEALSLMKQALIIMDRMELALPAAHLSMSIAALEDSSIFTKQTAAVRWIIWTEVDARLID